MTSSMAKTDIKRLRDNGATVTDDDAITINDLACALSKKAIMSEYAAAPRVYYVGGVILHEPTLQSDEWCQVYASKFFPSTLSRLDRLGAWLFGRGLPTLAYARAYALAFARVRGAFDTLTNEDVAVRTVVTWARSLTCTDAELMQGCFYATYGESYDVEPHKELSELRSKAKQDDTREAWRINVENGIKAGLGLSVEEIKTFTGTELYGIIRKRSEYIASQKGGHTAAKAIQEAIADDIKKARFQEYITLLDAIAKRGTAQ